jgi:hypothetical protein
MNKAFTREPDEPDPRCPGCDVPGQTVERNTVLAQVPADTAISLAESAFYCANPRCDVGYFDAYGNRIAARLLRHPSYPKDPSAPVCRCFGVTAQQIESDARAGDATGVRALIARAQSPAARCSELNPSGQCCVPQVQRIFLRHRAAGK